MVVLIAIAYIGYSLFFTICSYMLYKNIASYLLNLSRRSLNHLYTLPTVTFQKKRKGEYVHHFSVDIENTAGLAGWDIPRIIQQIFTILILSIVIGTNSIYVISSTILLNIIFYILSKYYVDKLRKIAKIINKKQSKILVRLEECISSTKEILIFNRIEWEQQVLRKLFNRYHSYTLKEEEIRSKQIIGSELLKWGTSIVVLGIGGYNVYLGAMSIGSLVVIYQLALQLTDSIKYTYDLVIKAIRRTSSVENIKQEYNRNIIKKNTNFTIKSPLDLKISNLYYKYENNDNYTLNKLSLDLPSGKKIAFVGRSGSGKTTLLNLLLKFDVPKQGSIKVNNRSLTNFYSDEWFKHIGIVFQEPYIFADTVRNNITLGVLVSDDKLKEICKLVCLEDDINNLPDNYNTILGERGFTISGGQRQRLALARALVRNPDILILDEATSALDIATESKVMRNIDAFRINKTTIIVAHRLSTIQDADIIYVFEKGAIVEYGKHNQLLEIDSIYSRLVKSV